MRIVIPCLALLACGWTLLAIQTPQLDVTADQPRNTNMQLGNFSISLTVKDVQASKEFYEKLGFKVSGGDLKHKYVVMQNENSTIGLYQGMFEKNTLTFNPGWSREKQTLANFQDVREIQKELQKLGLKPVVAADESTTGPAFLTLEDPDGNPILIDQHVPSPANKP